ncbi:MAG: Omp28-related outer membrane protein [Bacteroidota bacterium]|nr:Omp28-related outer membrane protein [Bacteroidota bacterium]
MKKHITLLSMVLAITSCDIIDGPYITDSDSYINPDKKVLIEDFTGHLCPNCPAAARELDAIHDIYGDQIIGMAIHVSKSFARPYHVSQAPSFQYDFRTNWGDNWDAFYGISSAGLPKGMVNRIGYQNESHKLGKDEWASSVANELKKDVDFKISIDADTNTITISSQLENALINNFNLAVCLTESNIINWQKDGQDNVEDYQHNHVLRTVIYDNKLSSQANFQTGEVIENIFEISLSELEQYNIDYSNNTAELGNGNSGNWNANNMFVIAYIYNTNTKEIVQVEEVHLNN